MKSFALDSNNNLIISDRITTKSGVNAIKQDIKTLLLMFFNEYPFDRRKGIDWIDLTLRNNRVALKEAIIKRLLQDARIKNIKNLDLQNENGKISITAEIYTSEGVINV